MNKTLLSIGLATALVGTTAHSAQWSYEGETGPQHWGEFGAECQSGKNQSPIDVKDEVTANIAELNLDYSGKVTALTNNGHTLQGVVEGDNTFTVDGKAFNLVQFHFHTPSENLIKSQSFPLEAHFVNADSNGNLAVLAVMYNTSPTNNSEIATLLETLPKSGETVSLNHTINVADMIPDTEHYYRFNGSLTTPPCSEGVRWFVLKQAQTLSQEQTKLFKQVMGKNNRPIQAKNARVVLENE
ncbi:carbonic anhydrase [Vibrio tubiashii]|jgi:carbonic anhydrase|uniref:Carbonic anhydrase n=1 Tax=Vibrio tubiashii ATCC 19109 TaxID=1051646 RepID=F9SZV5_9VIBR|nr:carbonic anhydrase family protein [Vibrio tubiashii]AIW16314.1 carbonic anhydrase [Vibrio tubiashii ATCC 19109]EGU59033.1 carbonic anhydrase [Vibrio tubiashii ATCC 19109]EIF05963.1 carbonic anhydrase [Vibrio tubiashii NCIMB 1337 = ATCC 19106]